MNEFDWIKWIQKKSGPVPRKWVGIGDDAAVIPVAKSKAWVISTDAIVEGIDFDRTVSAEKAGRKALAINLSDMAAMGAKPQAFLMTLGVPQQWNGPRLRQFIKGMLQLAKQFRVVCVGGDMSASKQFFCSISIFGLAPQGGAMIRSGAKPGDAILVTGSLGGSIKKKHYAFVPRVREAAWLTQNFRPSSLIDISDGLIQDLSHLVKASKCAASIHLEKVPISKDAKNIQSALSDGEDFELLMTMHPRLVPRLQERWKKIFPSVKLTEIGKIKSGRSQIGYLNHGKRNPSFRPHAGFSHF